MSIRKTQLIGFHRSRLKCQCAADTGTANTVETAGDLGALTDTALDTPDPTVRQPGETALWAAGDHARPEDTEIEMSQGTGSLVQEQLAAHPDVRSSAAPAQRLSRQKLPGRADKGMSPPDQAGVTRRMLYLRRKQESGLPPELACMIVCNMQSFYHSTQRGAHDVEFAKQ